MKIHAILILGSGKSHTIEGCETDPGVIPNTMHLLINEKQTRPFEITCSFVEIYNEKLTDLLLEEHETSSNPVSIRSTTSISGSTENDVADLKEVSIQSMDEFRKIFASAIKRRKVGATKRNQSSSRSHAVTRVILKGERNGKQFRSNLTIFDLAGAENAGDHMNEGDTAKRSVEMANINKSVTAFGTVIEKLKKKVFADFRSSQLTQLLKPSLTSNTKTLIITTISQESAYLGTSKHSLSLCNAANQIKVPNVKPNFATSIPGKI